MRILTFGSINIDYVYRVPQIVQPGQTLSCRSLQVLPGGKGANQSVAAARAGAAVWHAGLVGEDGGWVLQRLAALGVDCGLAAVVPGMRTGNAFIQVDDAGENSIGLAPGANHALTRAHIDDVLGRFGKGDVLLAQNETSEVPYMIGRARRQGLTVVFNPAPMTDDVRSGLLDEVDTLVVNETEGRALTGKTTDDEVLRALPVRECILTLGGRGARFRGARRIDVPAEPVAVVDSTAAGDTFLGYFVAARSEGQPLEACLALACRAAALCCTRLGAMEAIPDRAEVG